MWAMSVQVMSATIRYQHTDMLGSVVAESDAAGNISSRSHYEPFGKRMGGDKPGIGYTGHLQDEDLGLTYMQARYYDPLIGRFYANDPIGFRDLHSFNRYAYGNNSPYKYTDPDGKSVKDVVKKEIIRLIKNAKARGRRAALKKEQKDMKETGESKSNLTPERQKELVDTGKLKNMDGHHEPSVNSGNTLEEKIEIAENPDNIFFKEKQEHRDIHQKNGGTNKPIFKKILGIAIILDPTRGAVPPPNPFADPCASSDLCA